MPTIIPSYQGEEEEEMNDLHKEEHSENCIVILKTHGKILSLVVLIF